MRPEARPATISEGMTGCRDVIHVVRNSHVQVSGHLPRYVHTARLILTIDNECAVLNSAIGKPAAGVPVQLQEFNSADGPTADFRVLAEG